MGKWNYRPSRRFRRRSPNPPSIFYDIRARLPEFRHDGIPIWEKKYCTLSGCVPWQKIVDSKELIYCHHNVLDWKDSGAEEAFQNAKKRYWAKVNNLSCDISLPDPDAYIEEIDWNPCIDPELIKELDSAFFNVLDEEEQDNAINYKRTKISVDGENPWECAAISLGITSENNEVQRQNQGEYHDNSENVDTTDNPWESSAYRGNQGLIDNAWEGGHDKSRGWNEGRDHNNQCSDWSSGCLQTNTGWGRVTDSSWHHQKSNNFANSGNSWGYKSSRQNVIPMNTGWRDSSTNVPRWKQQEKSYVSSNSQFKRNNGGWTAGNQSNQMRGGSSRHNLGYNGSQLQRDDNQTGHHWRREQSRKRDFRA